MDRSLVKISLKIWRFTALAIALLASSCTSKPEERIPDERVMPFPNAMAQMGTHLAVSGSSADGRYHAGRLVVIDTAAVKDALTNKESYAPIAWESVVRSNMIIPPDAGEIYFSSRYLVTAGRENSQLIAVPISNGVSKCTDPMSKLDSCLEASTLALPSYDPFAIVGWGEELIVSYLSSDRLDLIKVDRSKTKDVLTVQKSLNGLDFVRSQLDAGMVRNQRIITRKMVVTAKNDVNLAKIYFLLELHSQKIPTPTKPKAAFIAAIKVSDLLANNALTDQKIEVWNLNELASIAGAADLFVDDTKLEAYVLARGPEALYKLDLANKKIIEVAAVCRGATSMAVDQATDAIVIPCFTDNRLTALSMATLSIKATSKVLGRGPSYVIADQTTGYIFCTVSIDGIVAVLNSSLEQIGEIFDRAPPHREGS